MNTNITATDVTEFVALNDAVAAQVRRETQAAWDEALTVVDDMRGEADEFAAAMNEDAERQLAETIAHQDMVERDLAEALALRDETNNLSAGVDTARAEGRALWTEAAEIKAGGMAPVEVTRRFNGRVVGRRMVGINDPKHPAYRIKGLLAAAETLMAWDIDTERAYHLYVVDGLADTDGHFAPLDRANWAMTR